MSRIAIVYHSGYGHPKKLAEAVLDGMRVDGADARLDAIDPEANLPAGTGEEPAAADTIAFASPTACKNKLFAGFTNSATMNGDKHSTLHYMITLAMQQGGFWIGTAMLPSDKKAAERNDVDYVGSFAGPMRQSPADSSPDEGPPPGDLETGRPFGRRVAEATIRRGAAA